MTNAYSIVCDDTSTINRAEWLLLRRQGLGSSDAAPAMGLSPWTSAYSLWAEKSGLLPETEDNERFLWGRLLEPVVLAECEARGWITGPMEQHLMVRSIERPWMLANPDGLTDDEVVEAKTSDGWNKDKWTAGVPDQYVLQAMWLMAVTGRRRCVFPVLFGGNVLERFVVEWDQAIADPMIAAGEIMWNRIGTGYAPDADGSEASMLALREVYTEVTVGGAVELPGELEPLIEDRRLWAQRETEAKKAVDAVKATVMQHLGNNELALMFGEPVATWNTSTNGSRRFVWAKKKESK